MTSIANEVEPATAKCGDTVEPETPLALLSVVVPTVYEPALQTLSKMIADVGPGCSIEQFDAALGFVQALGQFHKAAKAAFDANAIAKIDADGDVVIGETRYYAAANKTKKANDAAEMLDVLFAANGGDMKSVADCLCSDPFKFGEIGKMLGDARLATLITVKETKKLEAGKPKRSLQTFNPQFAR